MIIYVEWVLFDNFCLDFLLAYLTLRVTKEKIRYLPILLSATVGCGLALLSPLIDNLIFLYKIGTLFICSALFYLKKDFKGYLVNTFFYSVLSFLLAGVIGFLLNGSFSGGFIGVKAGGAVGLISIAVLFLLYVIRQIGGLIREKKRGGKYVTAELINSDVIIQVRALFDTGNLLTDENGEGVVVTDMKKIRSLGSLESFGEMQVTTASGSKVLKLVKIPKIKIYSEEGENIMTNVTAALSDLPDEYALILPCE